MTNFIYPPFHGDGFEEKLSNSGLLKKRFSKNIFYFSASTPVFFYTRAKPSFEFQPGLFENVRIYSATAFRECIFEL